MKKTVILIIAGLMILTGCRTKKLTEVETEIPIRAVEESFTFTREEDRTQHDDRTYFVIIGSFRERENANRYMQEMIAKGFTPVILLSETGFHRVSVNSYRLEADARRRILQIRSDFPEHEDTWLLIRKE